MINIERRADAGQSCGNGLGEHAVRNREAVEIGGSIARSENAQVRVPLVIAAVNITDDVRIRTRAPASKIDVLCGEDGVVHSDLAQRRCAEVCVEGLGDELRRYARDGIKDYNEVAAVGCLDIEDRGMNSTGAGVLNERRDVGNRVQRYREVGSHRRHRSGIIGDDAFNAADFHAEAVLQDNAVGALRGNRPDGRKGEEFLSADHATDDTLSEHHEVARLDDVRGVRRLRNNRAGHLVIRNADIHHVHELLLAVAASLIAILVSVEDNAPDFILIHGIGRRETREGNCGFNVLCGAACDDRERSSRTIGNCGERRKVLGCEIEPSAPCALYGESGAVECGDIALRRDQKAQRFRNLRQRLPRERGVSEGDAVELD